MRLLRSGRHFAAIEIDRQRHISLVREFGRLVFDPIIQAPPFVDHHERRKLSMRAVRRVQNCLYGFVTAFITDVLAGRGESVRS